MNAYSKLLITAMCATLLAVGTALADTVHLKNGKILRGEIIEQTKEYVVLRVPYGQVKVRLDEVEYIETQSTQEYQLELAREMIAQQRFSVAIDELERAHAANKDSRELAETLGRAYAAQGQHFLGVRRFEEARACFERLKVLDPSNQDVTRGLAELGQESQRLGKHIDEARERMARQNFDEAIEMFSRALAFSADARVQVARDLALCHAHRAEAAWQSAQPDRARDDLERAFGLHPELANQLENLYAACALTGVLNLWNEGHLAKAHASLERIRAFAPSNPSMLYVSGRVEEALGKLPVAAKCYADGLRVQAAHPTKEMVAALRTRLEKALSLNEGGKRIRFVTTSVDEAVYAQAKPGHFETLTTAHFTIYHRNDALAAEAGRVLEAHYTRIQEALGLRADWSDPPKVFLHPTQEAYTLATQQPGWTGGVSRFSRVQGALAHLEIHSWQTSPRLLKSVIPHELTHLIVNHGLPAYEALPRALHEGFAVLMEPTYRQNFFVNFLRLRMQSKEFIPLAELLKLKDYPRDPDFFYAEGYALVGFLVAKFGSEKALSLIRDAGKGGDIEARLLVATDARALQDLEKAWKRWLLNDE